MTGYQKCVADEAVAIARTPIKSWFYHVEYALSGCGLENHFLGGCIVLGWLGEGTRELRIRLFLNLSLCICWGLYPRVYIHRQKTCVVCHSNRAWNPYEGHNLCYDCFGATRCGVREHQVTMNDAMPLSENHPGACTSGVERIDLMDVLDEETAGVRCTDRD